MPTQKRGRTSRLGQRRQQPCLHPLKAAEESQPQFGQCAPIQMGCLEMEISSLKLLHCFKPHAPLSSMYISVAFLTVAAFSSFAASDHSQPLRLRWRKHSPACADNLASVIAASLSQLPCLCYFLGTWLTPLLAPWSPCLWKTSCHLAYPSPPPPSPALLLLFPLVLFHTVYCRSLLTCSISNISACLSVLFIHREKTW